ncbi:hypothetical protein STEG23_013992 [Scotinomys teguina]
MGKMDGLELTWFPGKTQRAQVLQDYIRMKRSYKLISQSSSEDPKGDEDVPSRPLPTCTVHPVTRKELISSTAGIL